MTSQPRAFFTLDFGSSTTSVAIFGHVGGRWRLIAHSSGPSHFDADDLLRGLMAGIADTDPALLVEMGAEEDAGVDSLVETWPRLVARTTPERQIAVIAGSRRQRRRLETAAARAGWIVVGGCADEDDDLVLSRLLLSSETTAVLLGADRTPGGDERRHLPDLVELVAAAIKQRPELTLVLAGGAAAYESDFVFVPQTASASGGHPGQAPSDNKTQEREADLPADEAPPQTKMQSRKTAKPPAPSDSDVDVDADVEAGSNVDGVSDAGASVAEDDSRFEPDSVEATVDAESVANAEPDPFITAHLPTTSGPIGLTFPAADAPAAMTHLLLAPDPEAGLLPGDALQEVLEGLRALPNDSRLGVARSTASLAYVLDRSVQTVEIGLQSGLIARSDTYGQGHFAVKSSRTCLVSGSFAPASPSEEVIDGVLSWSTMALDRHRAIDRLNDIRLLPWSEADGDGAIFRLAAAKAAFGRLIEAMPELAALASPELVVAAGGIFASLPPAVVSLAVADLVQQPGVSQLAVDHARVLGPLGAIGDEDERRNLLANVADDILLPLGALVTPAGVRPGKTAGRLRLKSAAITSEIELHPGAIQVVDLPPGRAAHADIEFRDNVRLGKRGHRFSADVGGGLSGLLVDLRDVPMRISDRPDSRRAALETWQRGMWPEVDE